MIIYKQGNIFNSNAQVITNTVNCVGVMGKGLALEFKNRFPSMFADYQKKCLQHEVKIDRPYLWNGESTQVLNFPTKKHWKDKSNLGDIKKGLQYLADNYDELGISSIALPPLGCGLGGLNWNDVKALIDETLGGIPDLDVFVYEPSVALEKPNSNDSRQSQNKSKPNGIAASSQEQLSLIF